MAHHVPVTVDDSHDPLNRMRAHQIAESLIEDAFDDAAKTKAEIITAEIAGQLYASICGIEASIGEAYSRSSEKERALKFEYALGEVRESVSWYKGAKPVLGSSVLSLLGPQLIADRRLLLALSPQSLQS